MTTTTATATVLVKGTYRLTGIERAAGSCDACGRELTQRVFSVVDKATGTVALELGRRCAAKATGYPANAIERQVAVAARFPTFAAAEYPALEYHLCATAATEDMWWNGGRRDGQWVDYLVEHGAR